MRTNIVLDEDLVAQAMKYSAARSKRGVVHEALATYVAVKAQEQRMATYKERLGDVRRKLLDASIRTSSRDIIRADRRRGADARRRCNSTLQPTTQRLSVWR